MPWELGGSVDWTELWTVSQAGSWATLDPSCNFSNIINITLSYVSPRPSYTSKIPESCKAFDFRANCVLDLVYSTLQ